MEFKSDFRHFFFTQTIEDENTNEDGDSNKKAYCIE